MTTKISGDNISSIANTGVKWNAVTVADGSTQLNASAGNGYFLDTNAGVIEVLLPTSPTRGDTIILADYSGTFSQNSCIVNTGGVLIDSTEGGPGSQSDFELTTNNLIVELVYVDVNKGWLVKENQAKSGLTSKVDPTYITATGGTITTSGDFKIHTFTGDGCFVVSQAPGGPAPGVDYLIIAGGGGGAGSNASNEGNAGGGAGGYRTSFPGGSGGGASPESTLTVAATTYTITVGAGGAAGPASNSANGGVGSPSIFAGTGVSIVSAGGGRGQAYGAPRNNDGGSGGGGAYGPAASCGQAGSGTTNQGFPGGAGVSRPGAGGGGGASTAGSPGGAPGGGAGGDGLASSITGSSVTRAGGGGGAANAAPGAGGPGGGGPGGSGNGVGACATANTGSGGGGGSSACSSFAGGAGGKGVVILRYKFQ